MGLNSLDLEFSFEQGEYGLSARRLWEHAERGQINVFSCEISERVELNDAATFIDLIRLDGSTFSLTGLTLSDLKAGRLPANSSVKSAVLPEALGETVGVAKFVNQVAKHLELCSSRRALRNQYQEFLPKAKAVDVFGVPFIFSTLKQRLRSMGKLKAGAEQWLRTIENFREKGVRAEEFEYAELAGELMALDEEQGQMSANELADLCDFKDLRLSVIPVISNAQRQIRFVKAPARPLKRTKKLPKAQAGQTRDVADFDPVLGYRIEEVVHQTLWGAESHWQAVLYDGTVLRDDCEQSLFPSSEVATELAVLHAKQNFPKRLAFGKFGSFAWTGGENYREWLITLPFYRNSYLSGHFDIRNVLAHVRCDVREGADGERILMLQEVQSDWAQRARRAVSSGATISNDEQPPPFFKEWSALTMKLILLHAAYHALDVVAWTQGEHQVTRYEGLGEIGLIELYDRTLPREVNRLVKPLGISCETMGVFVPVNFEIEYTEHGYEVYSPDNELLGTSTSLEEARQFVPDGGIELLYDVHGVRLSESIRRQILAKGFPAWG